MADTSTEKKRVEEYGVRYVKGRWSEWSLDGSGITCETRGQTSGLSNEDLAWLLEPHLASYVPAESPQPKAQGDGWVRCEERMPEVGAVVLTMHRRGGMVQAKLCDLYWRIYQQGWVDPVDVTHWRPLPAPPEVP